MKTLALSTAALLTVATAASANQELRLAVDDILDTNNISVDVESLTDDQVAQIFAIGNSQEQGAQKLAIESILNEGDYASFRMGNEMMFMPASSIRDGVEIKLTEFGYDVETDTLTDQQVVELYAIVQSTDGEPSRGLIDEILAK